MGWGWGGLGGGAAGGGAVEAAAAVRRPCTCSSSSGSAPHCDRGSLPAEQRGVQGLMTPSTLTCVAGGIAADAGLDALWGEIDPPLHRSGRYDQAFACITICLPRCC